MNRFQNISKAKTAKPVQRPPGLLCATCARRALYSQGAAAHAGADVSTQETFLKAESEKDIQNGIHIFQLKLRDWLNVPRVELRPCLSVCPSEGITVERRGKTMVLDETAIDAVQKQFDPTRQLSFLETPDDEPRK